MAQQVGVALPGSVPPELIMVLKQIATALEEIRDEVKRIQNKL